ncbi:cytochrome P450 [Spinellus fusiger]|nr:cytochrome P450 [Spinellus fusiger]
MFHLFYSLLSMYSIPFVDSQSSLLGLFKNHPLQSVGAIAASVALYTIYSSSKDKKDGFEKIPMPKGKYPYIGHMPHLCENFFLKLHQWHKELGPIIHFKMGVQDFLYISDPTIAHEIFNVNGNVTSLRPSNKFCEEYYSMNGRGLAFSVNKKQREARSVVNSYLNPKTVGQLNDVIEYEMNSLIDKLIKHGDTAEGVDPSQHITFSFCNVMARVCLGTPFESEDDPSFAKYIEINHLSALYSGFIENIDSFLPALSFLDYFLDKEKKRSCFVNNLRNPVFKGMIAKALESDKDCLVKRMKDANKDNLYDEDDILMIFNDMLLGGTGTISVTLSWAFVFLSHHPKVQKKICEEIDTFIAKYKRLPKFTEREEFPYMISVQRELMRLYTTTPYGVPHVVDEDFIFNNYLIKKGTTLVSDMYSMHRNPDVYPDPEKFIPERFINNKSTLHASANGNTKERDQFNFGWGRRTCPGVYLAETDLFIAYTRIWARCTVEPGLDSNGNPVYPDINSFVDSGLVNLPKPYKIRLVERPNRF